MAGSQASPVGGPTRVSVAVCATDEMLRLRWLVNALERQTVDAALFEVVVVHDPLQSEVPGLLASHALALRTSVRALTVSPLAPLSVRRNVAWRAAVGDLVAFCAPDLRPSPTWIEETLARTAPDAILEGSVAPDPIEGNLLRSPLAYTRASSPPAAATPADNIVYPRTVLAACDGFDEALPESPFDGAVLAARARRVGARVQPVPQLLAYAGIDPVAPGRLVRRLTATRHLPAVTARYPELGELAPQPPGRRPGVRAAGADATRWAAWRLGNERQRVRRG